MRFRHALALVPCLFASMNACARSDAKCLVSFVDENGRWSRPKRVDVEFYSSRELFPNEQHYPIYAKIWFDDDEPPVVPLDGSSFVAPEFLDSSLRKLFLDEQPKIGAERGNGQRWRIQAVANGKWIDGRYPEAFDPPMPIPPRKRLY